MLSVLIVAVMMMTMVASVASAASNAFGSKVIYCQENAEVHLNNNTGAAATEIKTSAYKNKLYVRHYLWGDWGGVYTNYFKAARSTSKVRSEVTLLGGKWMMPDGAFYVESTSIGYGTVVNAWGRGNTNYGLNHIEITGYSDPNA